MIAEWMWARADLRARWKSWVLLGLVAGATFGVVSAGVAGARRTADAVPNYSIAARTPTAAILANDPSFDTKQRGAVAALPEVAHDYPFLVPFGATVFQPRGLDAALMPTTARSLRTFVGSTLVEGRAPDPKRADEAVVDENVRDKYGLGIGSTIVVGQSAESLAAVPPGFGPPGGSREFRQRIRVVGIGKSVSSEADWVPSSGLYVKYGGRMPGVVNLFVDLRHGARDMARLRDDVEAIAGHPVNVESFDNLVGIRKATNVTGIERDGLLLFALAALLGGGVLVGQALVRAVGAGAADLPTWRAIGADNGIAVRALVAPSLARRRMHGSPRSESAAANRRHRR
jgi:hypothetical protein